MDLKNALVCAAMVFVLTDAAKRAFPAKLPALIVQALAFAIGIGSIFLVGATVWAHTQVIGGHALDTLNAGSKIVAGLLVGGAATLFDRLGIVQSRAQDPSSLTLTRTAPPATSGAKVGYDPVEASPADASFAAGTPIPDPAPAAS